ncbi:hypothetical protein PIROE2DRAFT_12063 [Piromyces sp. E2]|nr:hypothetical protein PIROE2DRAFT_12063 [Piromyces sp. E2]|eukprot:OUM61814.1 hypothetical protein PIROE2DRAFT_12063 [Piromyces sp. E2]
MIRNDSYPITLSSSSSKINPNNNNGCTCFEINESEGVDIINNILYGIKFPLRIKSLKECVSSLWVLLYEGLFRTRLNNIIRSKNAEFTESKIMNIQIILDQLKKQFNVPFPSKMAYELYSGNRTYINKFIYLFKILFDSTVHDQSQNQEYSDSNPISNQRNSIKTYSNHQLSIPSSQEVQEELQKYIPFLLDGETDSHSSQNQSYEKCSKKDSFSVKDNQKKFQVSKACPITSSSTFLNNKKSTLKKATSPDLDVIPTKPQEDEKILLFDHVNLEDSQLNFLLNSDNYPLRGEGEEGDALSTRLSNPKSNIHSPNNNKRNQDTHETYNYMDKGNYSHNDTENFDRDHDDAISTTSTQKSLKSNRTRSGANKYITLNDDIYRYIITNKITEGGRGGGGGREGPGKSQDGGQDLGLGSIYNDKPEKINGNNPPLSKSKSKENLKKKSPSQAGSMTNINKKIEKSPLQKSNTNINTLNKNKSKIKIKCKKKGNSNPNKKKGKSNNVISKSKKFTFGKDYISGCSERVQQNHREIETLKNKFSFLQSQYQSLTNDIHSLHSRNPQGMMETHRMEKYLQNLKVYVDITEQKDPMTEHLRRCKYFHYIGEDHNIHPLASLSNVKELDERLKKKKAMLDKIINKDPTLLNEMVKRPTDIIIK